MRPMYEDERKAARLMLIPLVGFFVAAVLLYTPPPLPPPPPSAVQGMLDLWTAMARLAPSGVPSAEPIASTAPPNSGAPSSIATTPSSAASAAPLSSARPGGRRSQPAGPVRRKPGAPGASDVVNPWASHE